MPVPQRSICGPFDPRARIADEMTHNVYMTILFLNDLQVLTNTFDPKCFTCIKLFLPNSPMREERLLSPFADEETAAQRD